MESVRGFQGGLVQHYLIYGALTLIVLLLWISPWEALFTRLFTR